MANGGQSKALDWVFEQTVGNAGAKLVLIAVARFARDGWSCFPSQETLAGVTEQGVRTVRRNLDHLDTNRFITRQHRFDEKGNRTSDLITLAPAANMAGSDQRPNRPVVKTATSPDLQELTSGQIGHRSNWPGKSFPTGKTEDKNTNKGGVGGQQQRPKVANSSDEHPRFSEWYAVYPVKKARGAAVRAFNKAAAKADVRTLISAARLYATDPQVLRGYGKHPATWLNAECWLDEPVALAATGTDGIPGVGGNANVNDIDWSKGFDD